MNFPPRVYGTSGSKLSDAKVNIIHEACVHEATREGIVAGVTTDSRQQCQVFAVPPTPANIQEKATLASSVSSQTGLTSKKLVSLQKQLKTLKRKCVRKEAEGEEPQQQTGIQEGAQGVSVYVTKWMSRGRTEKR